MIKTIKVEVEVELWQQDEGKPYDCPLILTASVGDIQGGSGPIKVLNSMPGGSIILRGGTEWQAILGPMELMEAIQPIVDPDEENPNE